MSLVVDIRKSYSSFDLAVAFTATAGVTALLGGSGSGKSLTLRCIAGVEVPDSGRIIINGQTMFDSQQGINVPPQARGVGYLFQQYALFSHMRVFQNIACVIRKPQAERVAQVRQLLATFELTALADLKPSQLSGGQQQRVALARMLATEPALMLLDEPLSALDQGLRTTVERKLQQLLEGFPGTTLLVTHDQGEAYRLSEQIALFDQGQIDTYGPKHQVFHQPTTVVAAQLTGHVNLAAVTHGPIGALIPDWGISAALPVSATHVALHPRAMQVVSSPGYPCRVLQVIPDRFSSTLHVCFAGGNTSLVLVASETTYQVGQQLYVTWQASDLLPLTVR